MSGTADEALGRAEELLERLKATRAELERLFAAEDRAMAEGRIGSDFMTITAVAPA